VIYIPKYLLEHSRWEDGCLVWTRTRNANGYGIFMDGRIVSRIAYEAAFGPLTKLALHTCDNPPCFYPLHLIDGDQYRNMSEAAVRGRLRVPHPNAYANKNAKQTTKATIEHVRVMLAANKSYDEIRITCKVGPNTISAIKKGLL
jgi:hypothetical protein